MSRADVTVSITLSIIVLVLFVLFCNRIFAVTFDETFARATGTAANMYNMLIAILTAVTIVIGMRMMGTMLISSLIIFPALTSMRLTKRFGATLTLSAVISVVCFLAGFFAACVFSLQTGAAVVAAELVCFAVVCGVTEIISKVRIKRRGNR
jgi:zinc transport system permease protein